MKKSIVLISIIGIVFLAWYLFVNKNVGNKLENVDNESFSCSEEAQETEETKNVNPKDSTIDNTLEDTEQSYSENNRSNENDNSENENKELNEDGEKILAEKEGIILKGKLNEYGLIEGIKLYVKETDCYIEVSENPSMNSNLEIRDIDNDGIKDVIIYEYLGGSGDIKNLYIYKKIDNQLVRVMGPEKYISQDSFYQEYLGDGNIYFRDENTGFEVEYNIVVPYENDNWKLEDIKSIFGMGKKAWVDPYSSFELIDINHDGVYEVKAGQIMCGVCHVDIIGRMETIYSLTDNIYKPTEVIYYKVNHDDWETEEIGRMEVKIN